MDSVFLAYQLASESLRADFRSRANKAVNQASINQTAVGKTRLVVAPLAEQRKIAACLQSLDELIALQTQKLDALKRYKKGLLQQLFPTEGETTPRLRFPQFRNSGEWQTIVVSELGRVVTGRTPSTADRNLYGGDYLFVTPADMNGDRFVTTTRTTLTQAGSGYAPRIRAGSICVVCIASIGKLGQVVEECATNQQINAVEPFSEYDDSFTFYALLVLTPKLLQAAGQQTMQILNKSEFSAMQLMVPKESEQAELGKLLGSLDKLISETQVRVALLRTHKAALMQQLFPTLDGFDA